MFSISNSIKKFGKIKQKLRLSKLQILLLIFVLAFLIRVGITFFVHPSGDAAWHLSVTRFIARNNRLPTVEYLGRDGFSRPPIFHIIGAIFYKIGFFVSRSETFAIEFASMVSPIFGSLNILVGYFIGKKLFSYRIGVLSALFMGFFPLHLDYSTRSLTDITATFFIGLTILSLVYEKYFLTGIFFGLSMLSKEYGVLTFLPIFTFIWFSEVNLKMKAKRFSIILITSFLIVLPFFIRNFLVWGNPFWPFLNDFFGGVPTYVSKHLHGFSLRRIFPVSGLLFGIFFNFFGVPVDPNVGFTNLSYIPMLIPIIVLWSIAMLIFITPFFVEFIKFLFNWNHKIFFLVIWMFAFILLILVKLIYTEVPLSFEPRFFLPALPAFAVLWASGFRRILEPKSSRIKICLYILLILILTTFPLQVFAKTIYHKNLWKEYDEHLQWVKDNTDKQSLILVSNPCFSYLLDRKTPRSKPSDYINYYVIYNDDFYLCSSNPESYLGVNVTDRNYKLIYYNENPDFRVYYFNSSLNTNGMHGGFRD